MWHEDYGYPMQMTYVVDQDFYSHGRHITEKGTHILYRMWGENMLLKDILTPTSFAVFSSETNDTTNDITIFGTSQGYPESETIRVNGASVVTGTTVFSAVDRIVKDSSTNGRISVTASGDTSIVYSVVPKGDITSGVLYKKIQVHPLPNTAFDMHVHYYKEPYKLVNDDDEHELGQEFDEAIILLSVVKIKAENSQSEAKGFMDLYKDELKTLKRTNVDKIDFFPKMRSANAGSSDRFGPNINYSQFGSYYGPYGR